MSSTITIVRRWAAVPHDPDKGPTGVPSMART
jgi:hypothetical protein